MEHLNCEVQGQIRFLIRQTILVKRFKWNIFSTLLVSIKNIISRSWWQHPASPVPKDRNAQKPQMVNKVTKWWLSVFLTHNIERLWPAVSGGDTDQGRRIYVPDIFTPNGDTLNDVFMPVFSGIASWSMEIFNRWGGKVYSSASPGLSQGEGKVGWDGNVKEGPAPIGVYAYYISAKDYDGHTIIKKGTLILER